MEHLPPVGWADVATRHDVAAIRADMDRQFGEVDRRFAEVDRRFDAIERRIDESMAATGNEIRGQLERELRLQTWRFITVVVALMGGVMAAVRL